MIAPEKVVDDEAAALDASLLGVADAIFNNNLPAPRVGVTFAAADREMKARIVRAFPDAGWRLHRGAAGDWWSGHAGSVVLMIEEPWRAPEPVSSEAALAELLGGDQ